MIEAAALGVGLGIVTGLPLGVINVAIVEAAIAGRRGYATGIGVGGAIADTVHAALAFLGLAQLVTRTPELTRVLAIGAAIILVTYAIVAWRRGRPETSASVREGGALVGVGAGLALTLPNPGALAAWVAVAASLWPSASTAEAIVLAVGVGAGSAAWFTLLGRLVARLPREHRVLRVLPKLALVALVAIAIAGAIRTVA